MERSRQDKRREFFIYSLSHCYRSVRRISIKCLHYNGLFKSQIIPLVYGLVVGKNSTDYERFFQCTMEEDDFNPESILTDFDAATIKAINSLFLTKVIGLLSSKLFYNYHLINSFQTACFISINVFGIKFKVWSCKKKYLEDKSFHFNVKKVIALTFVPVSDVIKGFDVVADEFDDDAVDLLGYFEKAWIEQPKKRGKLLIHLSFVNILFSF